METLIETRALKNLKATNPYLRMGTDVTELEKSIQAVGLIAPLVISTDNVILAGARRFQALLNLGYTEAPVVVVSKGELEQELISIDENLVRKDLNKIEIEGHLRRAKEIYQTLNPHADEELLLKLKNQSTSEEAQEDKEAKIEILPAQNFLNIVSEKTGLSPKQIHEAISRDEKASEDVKELRKNGELSISQTNEIVKLDKADQKKSVNHLKKLPVKDIKNFIKVAKIKGVEEAIKSTAQSPHAREFNEVESLLKRLHKKLKQLELEGINLSHMPQKTQQIFSEIVSLSDVQGDSYYLKNESDFHPNEMDH